ncbi:pentatricopeptide repeat-containing protein At1g62720-like isoform X2 [Gossypium raimondii]|uniref:pentatricopeptide repeat-containing protein At1g62720-like isoform X2 n=1 Tax=Gossypium raimondii TaxID=29730 RepID=UPI00227B171B|nr:pentatricopeptide repeat-containing protein At1g62720-like isoform X2 [Gossypium raimondii]
MGKLPSSFILRSLVNGGSHLSNFHSSSSSSSNTIAPHIKALSKKAMSVRGKGKGDDGFENVDHALILFNKMIGSQMELLGVSHDVYSVSILKLGVEPSAVTSSTLINGLCNQSKISEAVCMFDEMTEKGINLI